MSTTGELTAEHAEVYPTHVRRVFIWVMLVMAAGQIIHYDAWQATAVILLTFDAVHWWLERHA